MANQHTMEIFEHKDIIRSDGDKRIYRAMKLKNGMKVVLVSDPDTDKASAALDVHVGESCVTWWLSDLYSLLCYDKIDMLKMFFSIQVLWKTPKICQVLLISVSTCCSLVQKRYVKWSFPLRFWRYSRFISFFFSFFVSLFYVLVFYLYFVDYCSMKKKMLITR